MLHNLEQHGAPNEFFLITTNCFILHIIASQKNSAKFEDKCFYMCSGIRRQISIHCDFSFRYRTSRKYQNLLSSMKQWIPWLARVLRLITVEPAVLYSRLMFSKIAVRNLGTNVNSCRQMVKHCDFMFLYHTSRNYPNLLSSMKLGLGILVFHNTLLKIPFETINLSFPGLKT